MGRLLSINKKIENITFRKLDHRPRECEFAVLVDKNVIIKFKDGTFFSYRGQLGEYAYLPSLQGWHNRLLLAMRSLGVINTQDIKEHQEHCRQHESRQDRDYDRDKLTKIAKKYGFVITAAQRKALKFGEEKSD